MLSPRHRHCAPTASEVMGASSGDEPRPSPSPPGLKRKLAVCWHVTTVGSRGLLTLRHLKEAEDVARALSRLCTPRMRCPSCGCDNPDGASVAAANAPRPLRGRHARVLRTANPQVAGSTIRRTATGSAVGPDPRSYTPKHLAEKILTSRSALELPQAGDRALRRRRVVELTERSARRMARIRIVSLQILAKAFTASGHGPSAAVRRLALFGAPCARDHRSGLDAKLTVKWRYHAEARVLNRAECDRQPR